MLKREITLVAKPTLFEMDLPKSVKSCHIPRTLKQYQRLPLPLVLFSTFFFLALLRFYFKSRGTRKARYINKFPGGTSLPFVGNMGVFFGSTQGIQNRLTSYFRKHGKTVRFCAFNQPRLFTIEPEVIQAILSSSEFVDIGNNNSLMHYLGEGLVTSSGEKWRRDRKILNPGFSYNQFEGFIETFNTAASTLADIIGETFRVNSEPQPLHDVFGRCTFDIIAKSTLGSDLNTQYQHDHPFLQALNTLTMGAQNMIFKPWLSLPVIRTLFGNHSAEQKSLKAFQMFYHEITEKRLRFASHQLENVEANARPLIDILLDSPIKNDTKDLRDHVITFAAAGAESTSNLLNFALFHLAINLNCQAKVYKEIQQVFQNDFNRPVTLSDFSQLRYLDMSVKETLRLLPPFSWLIRKVTRDIDLADDRVIPKGCSVFIDIYDLHHDPDVYPNPEEFNPERFSNETSNKRHPYAYIPFSAGPRHCLGSKYAMLEVKVLLVHILRKYKVFTNQKLEELNYTPGIPCRMDPDIQLGLKLR